MKVKIEGVIRTTRPLHCATALDPDLRFDYTTRRPTHSNSGMPMTGTVTKGIVLNGQDRPDYVPFFPSNDIRGRLRREAARIVLESLRARDDQVTIDTFDGMNAGNFRGRPDNTATTLTEMQQFRDHFFMGLFGGGPRTLPSKLVTHDLDPIYDGTLSIGTVPSRYEAYAFSGKPYEMTEVIGCVRRDDTTNLVDLNMMNYIKDAFSVINDRQDELSVARNKRKKQKKASQEAADAGAPQKEESIKKDDLANMFAYQCIRTGLPLYLELGFSSTPSNAQVGLLLEALQVLFNQNRLGGRVALGFGRFDGHANLVIDGQNLGPVLQRQESTDDLDAGFILTDLAEEFIDAKDLALTETSSEDLNRFFVYGAPVEPLPEGPSEAA